MAKDGQNIDDLSRCQIGDSVSIIFDIPQKIADMVSESGLSDSAGIRIYKDNNTYSVHIPFKIIERDHSFSWNDIGTLQTLGTSIYVEAKSGYWEDMFKWICLNERPIWAVEDEQ
jgi:hypothetical protein